MSKFWTPVVKRTDPYVPGEQLNDPDVIKLNTNENPYKPSPRVIEAITKTATGDMQKYPSPTADELREAIAEVNGVKKENVFVGNGSDEVLAFAFYAFFEEGKTLKFPAISYSFYPVYSKLFNIPFEAIPLQDDFTLRAEHYFDAEAGVIFPNPNAPTSIYWPLEEVKRVLEANPDVVVIVDEAYIDFAVGGESAVSLIDQYPNLLVIQTTSKSRALAGLRVGLAIGQPELIEGLVRIKDSFNSYTIDQLALAGATEAFRDTDYFEEKRQAVIATRTETVAALEERGFDVLPSGANFVFAKKDGVDAERLYAQLKAKKVLVRHFKDPLIANYLRISIGTDEQMDEFFKRLDEALV